MKSRDKASFLLTPSGDCDVSVVPAGMVGNSNSVGAGQELELPQLSP